MNDRYDTLAHWLRFELETEKEWRRGSLGRLFDSYKRAWEIAAREAMRVLRSAFVPPGRAYVAIDPADPGSGKVVIMHPDDIPKPTIATREDSLAKIRRAGLIP
jgi:hypothetical protein